MIFAGLALFVRTMFALTGHRTIRLGSDRVPADGAAVVAINHTGYVDFAFLGLEVYRHDKRQIRYMGKIELRRNPVVRWLMWGCKVIAVDRSAGAGAYAEAVRELRRGEVVGIYPEGTVSRSFELKSFKTGAARMALEADVPIVPAIVWGSQRIATKGQPMHLGRTKTPVVVIVGPAIPAEGTVEQLTAHLREVMQAMLLQAQEAYGPHPVGEPWVPARLGGTAPTPEEAARTDG